MTPLINPTIKFDNVIINLNSFRIMGKIVKNQPFKSEQLGRGRNSQEFQVFSEQNFTIPSVFSPKNNQNLIFDGIDQKTKKIKTERKKRDFNQKGKFQPQNKKRYYLFPFFYSTQFPFCKISWENWKPNGYFVKMAEFSSNIDPETPNKTTLQCKSFDQRQKKEIHPSEDLVQACYEELLNFQKDPFTRSHLTSFLQKMDAKSAYMEFISNSQIFDIDESEEMVKNDDENQESCSYKISQNQVNEEIYEFFVESNNEYW